MNAIEKRRPFGDEKAALILGLRPVRAALRLVGATGLEPAISCSQSRRASHYATPRGSAYSRGCRASTANWDEQTQEIE